MLKIINDIFQFISVIITSILGIVNLLIDYKDNMGNITKIGKKALTAIIISSVISIISFGLGLYIKHIEEISSNQMTLETVQRSERIINDINRTLNPIKDVKASIYITVDLKGFEELSKYKVRLKTGLLKLLPFFQGSNTFKIIDGVSVSKLDAKKNVNAFQISKYSSLYPDPIKEKFARIVFDFQLATLYIYKRPIPIDSFPFFGFHPQNKLNELKKADLVITFQPNIDEDNQIKIDYDLKYDNVRIELLNIVSDSKYWRSTGEIISIPDLDNSQMFISVSHLAISFKPEDQNKRVLGEQISLFLTMTDGRRLNIYNKDLKEFKNDHENIFEYRYPHNINSLFTKAQW